MASRAARVRQLIREHGQYAPEEEAARAAGIEPVHLDPKGTCRDRDHRHVRVLAGIWRHVVPLRPL